jgi:predicted nucleotidyltransferase
MDGMDFELVFKVILQKFEDENIRYGLIGGFAMGVLGILRTTIDIDLLLFIEDLEKAERILKDATYTCRYKTEHVSQYTSDVKPLGNIDILHASKQISRGMLERTKKYRVFDAYTVPVLAPEDIIGLKVQAFSNNPSRRNGDVQDIRLLLEHASHDKYPVDWELLEDYFSLFNQDDLCAELKREFAG